MAPPSIFKDFARDVGPVSDTAEEMDKAEHNFDVVLDTAARVKASRLLPEFDTRKLECLVRDLKALFALIRRSNIPKAPRSGARPAKGAVGQMPDNFREDIYTCLCPLTIFLQLVAQGLNELNVRFRKLDVNVQQRKEREQWGPLMPLRGLLVKMDAHFERPRPTRLDQPSEICFGLATMIICHEMHSQYKVGATAPRYTRLTGLQNYAYQVRDRYINRELGGNLSPEMVQRIKALEDYSGNIKSASTTARKSQREPINPGGFQRQDIAGCNASFGNHGKYRTACLMDHWRFNISRPGIAQEEEDTFAVSKRVAYQTGSCAEWELYVTILANPDPEHPRPPPPAVRRENLNGAPKPPTWERAQTPGYNPKVGVVKASTASVAARPVRHPARDQIITAPQSHYPQWVQQGSAQQQTEKAKVKKRSCWCW